MSTNKIFNSRRFVNLIKNDLLIYHKSYMIKFAAIVVIMYLFLFFTMIGYDRSYGGSEYSLYFLMFLAGLATFIGSAFPALNSKHTANSFILLPASTFEKYLQQFLSRIVLGTLIFFMLFWIAAHLARFTALNTETLKASGVLIEPFRFSMLWNNRVSENFRYSNILGLITIGIFLFSTRIYFRQMATFKSVLLGVSIIMTCIAYLIILSHIFFPNTTQGYNISNEFMYGTFDNVGGNIGTYLLFSTLWVTLLILGYFKLKEKQA